MVEPSVSKQMEQKWLDLGPNEATRPKEAKITNLTLRKSAYAPATKFSSACASSFSILRVAVTLL